jgi:hypothetical protein
MKNLDLLVLLAIPVVLLFIGARLGRSEEQERQRRLTKVRGRFNGLDPSEVSDGMLNTIEAALPEKKN